MEADRMTLGALKPGQNGYVYQVTTEDRHKRRRIVDMGITPGTEITVVKVAPMGDPIEIALRGYSLSLRYEDASSITLMNEAERTKLARMMDTAERRRENSGRKALERMEHHSNMDMQEHERAAMLTEFVIEAEDECCNYKDGVCARDVFPDEKPVKLALAGNPNCGKTTLFNALTGSREYVGNWPGVTVEKKEGRIKSTACKGEQCNGICTHGHDMTLVDLPGIYSLSPYSMEEIVSRDFIVKEKPDAIINIVDGTNLERNLYLTVQLMELERPMIIALNMMDEVEKNGDSIDVRRLSLELGIPVIPISARTGMGIEDLIASAHKLIYAVHTQLHEGFNIEPDDLYDDYTHLEHHRLGNIVEPYAKRADLPLHWTEIKLLEGDVLVKESLQLNSDDERRVREVVERYAASSPLGDNETKVADIRYRYIENVCATALKRERKQGEASRSNVIDRLLTNKYLAIPVFLLIMLGIFTLTFSTLGAWLSDMVAVFIGDIASPFIRTALDNAGAMGWLTSLICDGIISGVGGVLTFLPQIALLFFCLSLLEDSGYMSRIAFIMDKPMRKFGLSGKSFIPLLMGFGCTVPAAMGTRTMDNMKDKRMTILLLPFMSCSAKLPVYGLIAGAFFARGRGLVIFSIYVLGVLLGILSGFIFKKLLFKGADAPFMIELPPYRWPSLNNTFIHVGERVWHFLQKAGTIIFAMSVVLWLMQSFDISFTMVQNAENSILGRIGGIIAPIFAPLGFGTWKAAVALLTGIVAKEAVVSSLSMFYGFSLSAGSNAIQSALSGTFTPLSAYSFLVFVLLYTPCIAAVTTMRRELGSRGYTLLAIVYQIMVAYAASLAVYVIGGLFI
ncbi:MAG: ferrous iron transport protein B [Clostridia bacterium]